jgi:hypothetical protein
MSKSTALLLVLELLTASCIAVKPAMSSTDIVENSWVSNASISTAQEKALAFIENVLPIDSSQYNITLSNHVFPELPDIGLYTHNDVNQEILIYSLESKDSILDVTFTLNDGVIYMCQADNQKGVVIADQPYTNTADAATSFLEKYQAYSKLDSTEMVALLTNVDPTENTTLTSENLKLTVTHKDLTGTWFGDSIHFRWVRTINGCDYLAINIVFRDGVFSSFIDHRARYSIGDPTVNISEEQAIKIAMEHIKNYSYRISDDWVVSDFNVTEERTVAELVPTVREGNVLYPYWSVTLYLNQTYPGSVTSLLLGIWADTGEVFLCNYQAYSGSYPISDSDSGYILDDDSGSESPSPSSSSPENNGTSMNLSMVATIAIVGVLGVALLVYFKKRKREVGG